MNKLDISVWGPNCWQMLHTIGFAYPKKVTDFEKKRSTKLFFKNLANVLPCAQCGIHLKEYMAKYPIDSHLGGREELSLWIYKLHNKVNKSTGGSDYLTFDTFKKEFFNSSSINVNKIVIIVLLCIIFLILFKNIFSKK